MFGVSPFFSRLFAVACLVLFPWSVMALTVGTLHWKPASGQAPFAEIDLNNKTPIDPATIRASVATRKAYDVAGLTYHQGLSEARISAQVNASGGTVLRLEQLPPNVPDLDLLLVVSDRVSLTLAEYRVDLHLGPHDVEPSPVGTRMARMAAAPKPSQPAPTSPSQDAEAPARNALLAWAEAWSKRDVDAYVASYTPDYLGNPPHATHQGWADERRARIEARKRIAVSLTELQLVRHGDTVNAIFKQSYTSDGPSDQLRKRVLLTQVNGRWLILKEIVLK